ncbi:flavodoxin [Allobranchiibius sp. GilTou73]|uniref:flavodoxin n=1 Tax=Allobranchiibius sp. GilTou73 TaxID=2904523 RepID=UPI001F3A8A98|nr:flavodoxin [Allobranchiibius sp. GilTou73]UIJ35601.1 flavodoxin [Allobranchiibius sp. GilTou73]
MATILVSSSRSAQGNTRRVATTIAAYLNADVISPAMATGEVLARADRIGFGSGIYWLGFDQDLVHQIERLPPMPGKDAFVFATSALPQPPFRQYLRRFRDLLEDKEFRVIGMFACRGAATWGPFKMVGGVSTDHPDETDLIAARAFATRLAP